MKVRAGFVSNSSSSSFVLLKRGLNESQLEALRHHIEYARSHFHGFYTRDYDRWIMDEREDSIEFFTSMDNFNMLKFMNYLHIPKENIKDLEEN